MPGRATTETASKRGAANRRKGSAAERDLAKYLRGNGWPDATRAVVTGYRTDTGGAADPGDIRGTPGLVWSVKNHAGQVVEKHVGSWLAELDAMAPLDDRVGGLSLLVVKRAGQAWPGQWWCFVRLAVLQGLLGGHCGPEQQFVPDLAPARLELGNVAALLRIHGYGTGGGS